MINVSSEAVLSASGNGIYLSLLKLLTICEVFGVNEKSMSHEQSTKLVIVDAPSTCPSGQIIISRHCVMVSLPSFVNISVGGEFDEGDPVFVGLHIIGICDSVRELSRGK